MTFANPAEVRSSEGLGVTALFTTMMYRFVGLDQSMLWFE